MNSDHSQQLDLVYWVYRSSCLVCCQLSITAHGLLVILRIWICCMRWA